MCTGKCRDLATKIVAGTLDALAERKTLEAADLDRSADFSFGFIDGLRHAFLVVADKALVEQPDFLEIGLQPGLDDLLDHVGRLALCLELIGQHSLLTLDGGGIEP